jgi:acyl-CoA thioester hydrolase
MSKISNWVHIVQFYETDLMGIVHHTNYLRFFEEARVHWAHSHGLIDYQKPESAQQFAVLETKVKHLQPARFGDRLEVEIRAKKDGIRVYFQYRLRKENQILSTAETVHVALSKEFKPQAPSVGMQDILERQDVWNETWL